MVSIRNSTGTTARRNVPNQTSTQPNASQVFHATEQLKRKTTNGAKYSTNI